MTMNYTKKSIEKYLAELYKADVKVTALKPLGAGVHGIGNLIEFTRDGTEKRLVIKTLYPENFGHDHFSDRAQVFLLANSLYNKLPKHIGSLDVVGLTPEGDFISGGDAREFYILMEEAEGVDYFNDLDAIKERGYLEDKDRARAEALADYLAGIHKKKETENASLLYKRKIRDTVGHGECLMGIIDLDVYDTVGFTNNDELTDIAKKSVGWWGKIKHKSHRLCQVHGDFHPGNIWFKDDGFVLLDRSRGEFGEPGDDVSCLTTNYVFYALRHKGEFSGPFKELFDLFWRRYLEKTGDYEMLEVVAPFYAFRVVVVSNPLFYPDVSNDVRRGMFNFANSILGEDKFDVDKVDDYIKNF